MCLNFGNINNNQNLILKIILQEERMTKNIRVILHILQKLISYFES